MSSDEIVWQIINQQFCSFKLKTPKQQNFCKNENNVSGLCNRQSCPLANSRYATIRSDPATGTLYLYMKTIERSHTPAKLWEKIKLSQNYNTALSQIDARLLYWPRFLIHKCKQRLSRLTQVAIRTRRLAREEERLGEKVVPKLAPKVRRREATRERKAELAAKVERSIERELLERLRSGAYGDRPLNVEEGVWRKVLKGLERGGLAERDRDLDEGVEEEVEEEEEYEMEESGVGGVEYVSDLEEDEELGDLEEWLDGGTRDAEEGSEDEESGVNEESDEVSKKPSAGAKRKRGHAPAPARKTIPKLEIEYEEELEVPSREALRA